MLQVHVGWDPREAAAYQVACASIGGLSSQPIVFHKLDALDLEKRGLLWRPIDQVDEVRWDRLSQAPVSTSFSNARFLVPFLQRSGWALFVDCDVVAMADIEELFAIADTQYAVMCVKHEYVPAQSIKMDQQVQTRYRCKNWSSVMLINCDHPAWFRLSLAMVNQFPGDLLHRFFWLRDSEIGDLPREWNWLVRVQPRASKPKLAHFTLGGPWLPGWSAAEHDDIWLAARELFCMRAT